jgi:hypothetical protein
MNMHFGLVDSHGTLLHSDLPHGAVKSTRKGNGSYVVEFTSSVLAFVGTAHGGGESCNARQMVLTASIDHQDTRRMCVTTVRADMGAPLGPIEDSDFSFVVALPNM